jgi:hypothetical protein
MNFWSEKCEQEDVRVLVNDSVVFPLLSDALLSKVKVTLKNNFLTLTEYKKAAGSPIPTVKLRINGEAIETSNITVRGLINRAIKTSVRLSQDTFVEIVDSDNSKMIDFYEVRIDS